MKPAAATLRSARTLACRVGTHADARVLVPQHECTRLTEPRTSVSGGLSYLVSVMVVCVPFGTMSILCAFTTNLVAGFSSCFVTTSLNSGSS